MSLPEPVERFLAAIADLDADAAADCFAADGIYAYAVPHPPATGREAIRAMFTGLLGSAVKARWDVVSTSCDGDRVWMERVDRFWFGDREVAIECAGVLELDGDDIRVMRDYVDLQTWRSRREPT